MIDFLSSLTVLEYQTAVMRQDFETADQILPQIDEEHRTRVAQFLEKQGFKEQAMAGTCIPIQFGCHNLWPRNCRTSKFN